MSLVSLSISTAYISLTSFLAYLARKIIIKTNLPAKDLFFEAIAAAELCACCFELIIGEICLECLLQSNRYYLALFFTVADNFGVATYAIFLFFLTIWWSYNWEDASACPYTHMEDLCEGNCSVKDVALKTWAALMGGCCIFRYVQFYWWLEVTENHEGRAFEDCSADLKVDPYVGAVIEGIATLLCRIASKSIAELNPRFGTIIDSFIGTSLVVLGNNLIKSYKKFY